MWDNTNMRFTYKTILIVFTISLIPFQGSQAMVDGTAPSQLPDLVVTLSSDTPDRGVVIANVYYPFTKIDLKAIAGDVIISKLVVKRTSVDGEDSAFDSISLVDADNNCSIGSPKELSNGLATFFETIIVKSGKTRSLYLSGNMVDSLISHDKEVHSLALESLIGGGFNNTRFFISSPIFGIIQTLSSFITQEPGEENLYGLDFDPPPKCVTEENPDPRDLKQYGAIQPSLSGSLVKVEDQSTVYLVKDGKRFPFPTQKVYDYWYGGNNFSAVTTISPTVMASYILTGIVTYKPGTLVKVPSDPKVYLVTDNGGLRWIRTESKLNSMGLSLNQVLDLPEVFFFSYTVGEDIF